MFGSSGNRAVGALNVLAALVASATPVLSRDRINEPASHSDSDLGPVAIWDSFDELSMDVLRLFLCVVVSEASILCQKARERGGRRSRPWAELLWKGWKRVAPNGA